MWLISVFCVVALCATIGTSTTEFDPGRGGAIVDVYVENLRTFLRQNDLETMHLPEFEFFKNKSWNVLGTQGSFGDLTTVQWADRATVVENGDVTNVMTSLYIPKGHLRYKITFFDIFDLDVDVKIITNALNLDLNFNQTDCSVKFNQIDLYYFDNLFPKVRLGFLDNPLVPREYADFVESSIAVAIEITNSIFNIIIKPTLTKYVSQSLTSHTQSFNICPIFKLEHEV